MPWNRKKYHEMTITVIRLTTDSHDTQGQCKLCCMLDPTQSKSVLIDHRLPSLHGFLLASERPCLMSNRHLDMDSCLSVNAIVCNWVVLYFILMFQGGCDWFKLCFCTTSLQRITWINKLKLYKLVSHLYQGRNWDFVPCWYLNGWSLNSHRWSPSGRTTA